MVRTLLFVLVMALALSCKKNTLNLASFWQCNKAQNLDTTAMKAKLIRSWRLKAFACGEQQKTTAANNNIVVTFRQNFTFTVTQNNNLQTQGTWQLVQVDGNSWGLKTSQPSEYLHGRMLFCNNQLLLNNSYVDGCDHYFSNY